MVNIPVVADVFALRAVGWITREDGWIDNTLLGNEDINDNELEGGRLAGSWFVNEDLTLFSLLPYFLASATTKASLRLSLVHGKHIQAPGICPKNEQKLDHLSMAVNIADNSSGGVSETGIALRIANSSSTFLASHLSLGSVMEAPIKPGSGI